MRSAPLLWLSFSVFAQSNLVIPPPVDIFTKPETDQQSMLVKNAMDQINSGKGLSLARDHAWQLWERINTPANPRVSNSAGKLPKWFTWCTDEEVERQIINKDLDCEGLLPAKRSRRAKLAKLHSSSSSPSLEAEEVYVSPMLVRALAKWQKLPNVPYVPPDLFRLSVAVKAQYKVLQHPLNRREKKILGEPMLQIWNGVAKQTSQSLNGDLRSFHTFWPDFAYVQISSEQLKPSACKGTKQTTPRAPMPVKPKFQAIAKLDDFFYFQYCEGDGYTFADKKIQYGDFIILTGLHLVTNLAPNKEWTWATFYWHPDRLNSKNFSVLSPRLKELQKAPINLTGWRGNYRLDLQYSRGEQIPGDEVLTKQLGLYKTKHNGALPCNLTEPKAPGAMYNPYIEGAMPCGIYSNCISCHSKAKPTATQPMPESKLSRKFDEQDDDSAHFLWTLARRIRDKIQPKP
jgi:hypothetical protein